MCKQATEEKSDIKKKRNKVFQCLCTTSMLHVSRSLGAGEAQVTRGPLIQVLLWKILHLLQWHDWQPSQPATTQTGDPLGPPATVHDRWSTCLWNYTVTSNSTGSAGTTVTGELHYPGTTVTGALATCPNTTARQVAAPARSATSPAGGGSR